LRIKVYFQQISQKLYILKKYFPGKLFLGARIFSLFMAKRLNLTASWGILKNAKVIVVDRVKI